jgi:hypothetical protein
VLAFPVAPIDAEAADAIETALAQAGTTLHGRPATVRFVPSMRSLATRPIGAFAHPLR